MAKGYWLVKQEPEAYPWSQLVQDGVADWSEMLNYQAQNYLRQMRQGDEVLHYHSVSDKCVIGIAKVLREHYPNPTDGTGKWSAVDILPLRALKAPVGLETLKADPALTDIPLLKQSRLSVMPLEKEAFERILALGKSRKSKHS